MPLAPCHAHQVGPRAASGRGPWRWPVLGRQDQECMVQLGAQVISELRKWLPPADHTPTLRAGVLLGDGHCGRGLQAERRSGEGSTRQLQR